LLSLWPYRDEVNWTRDDLFQSGYILASLGGQLLKLAGISDGSLPPGKLLIDGLTLFQSSYITRKVINILSI
jgi:hypothetical protein